MKIEKIRDIIRYIVKYKFRITIIVFVLWVLFIDRNSLISRIRDIRQLHKLENERDFYYKRISQDSARLYQLKTNNNNLEKFAREQYLMHRDNEDVYVIIEDED